MLSVFTAGFQCKKSIIKRPLESVKFDFHLHDNYEIYILLSGGVRYFVEKNSYELVPGDILLIRPGEIHKAAFTSNETYERIVCNFPGEFLNMLSEEDHMLSKCYTDRPHGEKNRLVTNDDERNELLALFEKMVMLKTYPQSWNPQLLLSAFIEAMVKINRIFADETRCSPSHLQHRKLKPILDYIDSNLNKDLSLKILQRKFFISGSYLCQIFKQTTGSTLHEYIVYKRISRAKQYLMSGESASNAAYKSGFSDYSNFVRAFRKVTGYSPREYTKQALP
ncbi:MAG TPA: AraC family transcriptional regulator [Clostridia bacterium]